MAKHAPAPKKRASSFDTLPTTRCVRSRTCRAAPSRSRRRGTGAASVSGSASAGLVSSFDEVVEILSLPPVTPVPGAQSWMLGVANVRGSLLPVVDLKQFLEGERTVVHDGQRVLVVRQSGGNVAVIIDELFGQRTFNDTHRAELDGENEGRYGQLVDQVYRLADTSWGVFSMQRADPHARIPAGHAVVAVQVFQVLEG